MGVTVYGTAVQGMLVEASVKWADNEVRGNQRWPRK
jgi:hypothetical protein